MAADQGDARQAQQGGGFGDIVSMLGRGLLMYCVVSAISGGFSNKGAAPETPGQDRSLAESPPTAGTPGVVRRNIFRKGQMLDMWLYTSGSPRFLEEDPQLQLLWHEEQVKLCEESNSRSMSLTYPLTPALQNNGTAYLHVIFTRTGMPPLPSSTAFVPEAVFGGSYELVKYIKKPKDKVGTNLLAGDSAPAPQPASELEVASQAQPGEIWAHWKPNVTIALVDDFTAYPDPQIPPTVRQRMVLDPYTGNYFPHVWFNDFWLLKEHLVPLNSTLEEVELHLELTYANLFKWQLMLSVEESVSSQSEFGGLGEHEADTMKRIFIESNPYFLGLTMVVSLLHMVFDMLAFKNDIGFWKNNKSMEGLSARSILINAGCQLVIFLYLVDNETSYTILFSSGIGTAIEFWKVTKAMNVSVVRYKGIPMLKFEDRETYAANKTKQYDAEASRYLSFALYPLVICYAIYALIYQTHRSWYSWVLGSLVGAVYAFGFILMCPQLFINYKLKSVAHMPWRQMTYKFLNTIMDDLFAFVIKMPLLHRLSVFRDDIIFLIFLYQRWIYRVDKSRINEFGYSEEAQPGGEAEVAKIKPAGGDSAQQAGKTEQQAGSVRRRGVAGSQDGTTETAERGSGGPKSSKATSGNTKKSS